jgi:hypothetical protein
VRRLLANVLVALLVGPWGQALPQHVHAAADHAHGQHEHGPAAHVHVPQAHVARHQSVADERPHVEACDVADHSRSTVLAATCSAPAPTLVSALAASPRLPVPPVVTPRLLVPTDTRVHDPPSHASSSPRAPPLTNPA